MGALLGHGTFAIVTVVRAPRIEKGRGEKRAIATGSLLRRPLLE
jgi:hypothetical protein